MYVDDDVLPYIEETLLFTHPQWSQKVKGAVSWLVLAGMLMGALEVVRWVVMGGLGW